MLSKSLREAEEEAAHKAERLHSVQTELTSVLEKYNADTAAAEVSSCCIAGFRCGGFFSATSMARYGLEPLPPPHLSPPTHHHHRYGL